MSTEVLFYAGERLDCSAKPDWGIGQVLADTNESTVEVFFEYFGKISIDTDRNSVNRVETGGRVHPILDTLLEDLNWKQAHHNVYVVLLENSVLNHKRFLEANRHFSSSKPCVYVGLTGLNPEARFRNHKRGYKSNFYVHKYGTRLMYHLFRNFNPMPYRLAQVVEEELAARYRSLGYGVWQH